MPSSSFLRAGGVRRRRDPRAGLGEVLFEQFANAVVVIHQQEVRRAIERVEGGRGGHMRPAP